MEDSHLKTISLFHTACDPQMASIHNSISAIIPAVGISMNTATMVEIWQTIKYYEIATQV